MKSKLQTLKRENWENLLFLWLGRGEPKGLSFTNVEDESLALLIMRLLYSLHDSRLLMVFPNSEIAETQFSLAKRCHLDFPLLRGDFYFLPELVSGGRHPSSALVNRFSKALDAAVNSSPGVFFTSCGAMFSSLPAKFAKDTPFSLLPGLVLPPDSLAKLLVEMNYADEYETVSPGEFSRRGGIVDLFSPSEDFPARLEFFGDRIESVRLFDPAGQRTVGRATNYRVASFRDFSDPSEGENIRLSEFFQDEKNRMSIFYPSACEAQLGRFFDLEALSLWGTIKSKKKNSITLLDSVESSSSPCGEDCSGILYSSALPSAREMSRDIAQDQAFEKISKFLERSNTVVVATKDEDGVAHVKEILSHRNLQKDVRVVRSALPYSFILDELKLVYVVEDDLLALPFRSLPRFHDVSASSHPKCATENGGFFSDFDEGDHVVHNDYGIGVYRGIVSRDFQGVTVETMQVEFADEVMTYTDLRHADLLSRYSGAGKLEPTLSSVGGKNWAKARLNTRKGAAGFAAELLKIQASRLNRTGFQFIGNRKEERLFEKKFPFTETADQRKVTDEIIKGMESSYPMDRLICGDAGYGKTEVAMRAAFKALISGKQVAVLVPTTVLAQQHYYTFVERFSEYPFIVEMLSRFKARSEQYEIMRRSAEGSIDILIGTHRILQKDMRFKDLGLLIIDEEQRFGVEHKERLKSLRSSVDMISMSATPIPRTLYMAMTGIRDLSTISTPPSERQAVLTYMSRYDEKIVADAVNFEIERGGQVFYLHNRVKTIVDTAERLAKFAKGAKIGIAHGQMDEDELEEEMLAFLQGKTQILCCTTIIESGIDVPNANTLIVERADRFGLAELYQLRGRVGRGVKQAYAYFLIPPHLHLTANARERMAAVKRHGQLGAGFRVALRDLEIRGSGNLVGTEQSGYINAVGFELYCHYLKMAAAELRGERLLNLNDCELAVDFIVFGQSLRRGKKEVMETFIPVKYMEAEKLRYQFYRKIALAGDEKILSDISAELDDRFGQIPKEV